jgi:hypothetical protein
MIQIEHHDRRGFMHKTPRMTSISAVRSFIHPFPHAETVDRNLSLHRHDRSAHNDRCHDRHDAHSPTCQSRQIAQHPKNSGQAVRPIDRELFKNG